MNAGNEITKPNNKKIKAIILKNKTGLYSLNKVAIILSTLYPSENVFNLL